MYDITKRKAFESLPKRVNLIKSSCGNCSKPIFLVENRLENENYRIVSKEEGINYAKEDNF